MTLKDTITQDMKQALRERDKPRLSALRLLLAAIRQQEIDSRAEADDAAVLAIIARLLKQRRDSESQYRAAGRADLADGERAEAELLSAYLPARLSEDELRDVIGEVIAALPASGLKDMGRVMTALRPRLAGRADMAQVSALVRAALSS